MLEAWRIAGILIHSPRNSRSEACRRGRSRTRRPCNRCGLWPIGGPTACDMWKQEGDAKNRGDPSYGFHKFPAHGFPQLVSWQSQPVKNEQIHSILLISLH